MKTLTTILLMLGGSFGGGAQADEWSAGDKTWTVVHDSQRARTLVAKVSQRFDQEVTVLQMSALAKTTDGSDYTLVLKKLDCSDRGRQTIVEERRYALNNPQPIGSAPSSAWHIIGQLADPEAKWVWDAVCGTPEPEEKALPVLSKGQTFEQMVGDFRSKRAG